MTPTTEIIHSDCVAAMAEMPERHFHCCVTSPPYWGLRDYQVDGQIGLEESPDEFVAKMVDVFRGVWRVLRDDGVLWVNLGDCYSDGKIGRSDDNRTELDGYERKSTGPTKHRRTPTGYKPKDLMGMPWQVAFALRNDGWYLRDAVAWHKPSPMPTSQHDRCTSSYEFVFQLTKRPTYFFDMEAIKEPAIEAGDNRTRKNNRWRDAGGTNGVHRRALMSGKLDGRSMAIPRNVWRIASEGCSEAHFATFPPALPAKCIQAATSTMGCCAACGAPRERITEKHRVATRPGSDSKVHLPTGWASEGEHNAIAHNDERRRPEVVGNRDAYRHVTETVTVGWKDGCACKAESIPCRVLDPFSGAASTGIACRRLGVSYTGIELSQDYIDLSWRRLNAEANRGGKMAKVKSLPGQQDLFA